MKIKQASIANINIDNVGIILNNVMCSVLLFNEGPKIILYPSHPNLSIGIYSDNIIAPINVTKSIGIVKKRYNNAFFPCFKFCILFGIALNSYKHEGTRSLHVLDTLHI